MSNTISAYALRSSIEGCTDSRALELESHTGYVCDAVSEIADGDVSVYTADQVDYCRSNPDAARDAIAEGLAMDGGDYFRANPGADFEDYEAHIGACAWFMDSEAAIYADIADAMRYAALGRLAADYGDDLDADAWAAVDEFTDWDDNNARIEDVVEEAADAYREAVEEEED